MYVNPFPQLKQATLYRRFKIGGYLFLEWINIPSNDMMDYHYVLQVGSFETKLTQIWVASEIMTNNFRKFTHDDVEKHFGSDFAEHHLKDNKPFLKVYHPDGLSENHGNSEKWLNKDSFFKEAREITKQKLGLQEFKVEIKKDDLWMFTPERDSSAKLISDMSLENKEYNINPMAFIGFATIICSVLAYCAYDSAESPEQKNFMLGCLSKHNETFCDRLWERHQEK